MRRGSMFVSVAAAALLATGQAAADATAEGPAAVFDLAEKQEALVEYAQAADLYEAAARKFPKEERASNALWKAIVLRIYLGEVDKAKEDAELFAKVYGASKPVEALGSWLVLATVAMDHEDFEDAKKLLAKHMAALDRLGSLDERIRGHATFARSLQETGDAKGAERAFERVLALWKERQAAQGGARVGQGDAQKLGRVLTAVGEALYFFAEKKRHEVEAIRFPEYKGSGKKEDIERHISTKVADWIKRKHPAIEAAENAYLEIVRLEPAPPPKWVVAGASRVGQMWGRFNAELRASPIPKAWRGNGPVPGQDGMTYKQLREMYYGIVDVAAAPLKLRAKEAFKTCLAYSTKLQQRDAYARTCGQWLLKNYHAEFRGIEEPMPFPRMLGFSIPAAPVQAPPGE